MSPALPTPPPLVFQNNTGLTWAEGPCCRLETDLSGPGNVSVTKWECTSEASTHVGNEAKVLADGYGPTIPLVSRAEPPRAVLCPAPVSAVCPGSSSFLSCPDW